MASNPKDTRPKARLAKGFRDVGPDEIRGLRRMLAKIQDVYESYGFEPLEQPFIEYTDALGKFLPDQDRPNAGVFSFQDDDDQWLSLRYDLTAPLARYVAENQQKLPTPFRSYRQGWVFRNEKPGPGRFRQFMQFDADTVGSASTAADAEVCMMAADTMEALGIEPKKYVVKFNSRKLLDGILNSIGLAGEQNKIRRLQVMRALDKYDRLGREGVGALLGLGREDESGDFTQGAKLDTKVIDDLLQAMLISEVGEFYDWTNEPVYLELGKLSFAINETFQEGLRDLREMTRIFDAVGYRNDRVRFDSSVVRGLEYYTGAIFECELLMETKDDEGRPVRFGSVGGGGRYDDLVARFTGQTVPATGFSLGVSRLYAALKLVGKAEESSTLAPVVVLVMDKERLGDYQKIVMTLRAADIRAEMYVGTAGMKAQMKYADKRGAPLVIIQGGEEKAKGEVQIKDLVLGAELASGIQSREDYAGQRLAQFSVPESDLVKAVQAALARRSSLLPLGGGGGAHAKRGRMRGSLARRIL